MSSTTDITTSATTTSLGTLESAVMEIVWSREKATVRDVYRVLTARREIAYTTVMTVMSNLTRKNVLQRHRRGRAYVYIPIFSREEFNRSKVVEFVGALKGWFTEPAMTYLVDRMVDIDPQSLTELEHAIEKLRKERKGDGE